MKKPFNPKDYEDEILTVKELSEKFPKLLDNDYKKVSLLNELVALNYEIISSDYEDFAFSNIEDYFHFEVDSVV